jgi:hypothetical protein
MCKQELWIQGAEIFLRRISGTNLYSRGKGKLTPTHSSNERYVYVIEV